MTRKFLEENQRRMIDTSQERFQQSAGLKHWADKENLKTAAKIVSDYGNRAEMEAKITELNERIRTGRKNQVEIEHRRRSRKEAIQYGRQYFENKTVHDRYEKCAPREKERYYQAHETELLLYDGAVNVLKSHKVNLSKFTEKAFQAYVAQDEADIKESEAISRDWKDAQKEVAELARQLKELNTYMGEPEKPRQEEGKTKKRGEQSL